MAAKNKKNSKEANRKTAEGMKDNDNAEKWTLEKAHELFDRAIELTDIKYNGAYKYDFIGEVARELKQYKEIFSYLKGKFPELKRKHKLLITNMEASCFYNTKKGNIKEGIGIVNLKSNHNWTDRIKEEQTIIEKKTIFKIGKQEFEF